jgi:hypothetical protein
MTLWLALFLLAPGDLPTSLSDPLPEADVAAEAEILPEPVGAPQGDHILLRARVGLWGSPAFHFDAVTTSNMELNSKIQTLFTGGVDVGGSILHDRFVIFASIEGSFANKIQLETASICLGWRDWAGPNAAKGVPNEVLLFTGPMVGRFDISTPGFGKFDTGIGVRAGMTLTWKLTHYIGVSFDGEYRFIQFDFKDKSSLVSGDTSIGGSGYWLGVGLDFRF